MSGGGLMRRKDRVHKHPAPQSKDQVRSEMNVTPLVDVCLVLLIIFMVITPLLARGKEVKLPRTRHHSQDSDKNQPIVAIDDHGFVYLDKEQVAQVVPMAGTPPHPALVGAWEVDDPEKLQNRIEDAWHRIDEQGVTDDSGSPVPRKVFIKAHHELPYAQVYPVVMAVHGLGLSSIDMGVTEIKQGAGQ